jgi:hypothetical protein
MFDYDPRTITLTNDTRNDAKALEELQFDLRLALQKELRPARLKEIIRKDPARNPYPALDDKTDFPNNITRVLIAKIVSSHWFVTRLPPTQPHGSPDNGWYERQKELMREEEERKAAATNDN